MRKLTSDKSVIIEDNVWIGDMVSIMPGVKIGQGSIIGSNAIVTKNIPPFSIAVGVPAKVIKTFDREKSMWVTVK
jgi:acetyltransferase-like isoleucine patch superfamily enzyme